MFSLLQATAVVSTLAILLWSVGVPTFRFAEAANVISFSDVISDSAPTAKANHTLTFETPNGLPAGGVLAIEFQSGFTGIGSIVANDIDLIASGTEQNLVDGAPSGSTWGVSASGQKIEITNGSSAVASSSVLVVKIGTNASNGAAGINQISNPAAGSYVVNVDLAGGVDSGDTRVMIVEPVTVTASVDTIFTFTVLGVGNGLDVNSLTTTGTSTSNTVDFGTLTADTPTILAQDLKVETNAANGFTVTVKSDQQLTSSNGAVIDSFKNGGLLATPDAWESPTALIGSPTTYGHWGLTAETDVYGVGISPLFTAVSDVAPTEVFSHTGPVDGTGVGLKRVGYSVEISALQEAANDYTATLTYVATPVF